MLINYEARSKTSTPYSVTGKLEVPADVGDTEGTPQYIQSKVMELHKGYLLFSYCPMESPDRITDNSKWESVLSLAQQGFKPKDIIELPPSSIKVIDGKTIVSVNGKTATLSLNESKVMAKYVNANYMKITEFKVLFFGTTKEYRVDQVVKSFRGYLKRHHPNITLVGLGWTMSQELAIGSPIETIEDCQGIFKLIKGVAEVPKPLPKPPKNPRQNKEATE